MPVLDIAANQQYAQPVTAYYQGKAMRLAEQMNQRKMEMAEEEMVLAKNRDRREQEELELSKNPPPDPATIAKVREALEPIALDPNVSMEQFGQAAISVGNQFGITQSITPEILGQLRGSFGKAPAEFGKTPKPGVNPATGKEEYFVTDQNGNEKWLGASPPASDKNTYGTGTTAGINPMTGKMDTFVQGKDGSTKWLGIAPAESNKDENPFGNSERGRALFIQLQRIPPGPARDAARDKWSALVAEMPQHRIDPVTGLPTTTQVDFPGIGSDAPPSAQSSSVEQPYPDVPEEDLAESADVIAGPIASVKRLLAKTPLIGIKAGDETEAAKFAEQVNRDLVDSFRRSPRFAEMDRKDLEKEFDFNPAGYDTQQSYLTRLAQVTKNVETKINQHSKTINENGISKEERQKRMNLLVELKEVRALMAPIRLDTDDQVEEFYETAEPGDKFFAKHPITDQWTVFTFNGQGGE